MPKTHSNYVCQQCGYSQVGWSGKCPNCNSWGSLVETVVSVNLKHEARNSKQTSNSNPINLTEIKSTATKRISTQIPDLDRVLGGGLVPGQVVLLAGEPGIGKSTLLLQLADKLGDLLYISGEESSVQIKIRADRLGIKKSSIKLLEGTDVDSFINTISTFQGLPLKGVVIDSIQTIETSDLSGMAGSVGQVRECASRLMRIAKETGIPLFLVGHVTKEGTVAGPAVLAHIVDTVLWFEGDKSLTLRLLRSVKNRFGPTDEVGIFEMEDKGLISVDNLEKLFLSENRKAVAGSVITSVLEGTRPMLIEIQSLVVASKLAFPKRTVQGVDSRRVEVILAVLTRRCGLPLYDYDVFVNVAGGIKVSEPSCDLAVALCLASSFFDKPIPEKLIAIGEVGLLGEIREVIAEEKRLREARRLGFNIPATHKDFKYLNEAIRKYLK